MLEFNESTAMILVFGLVVNALAFWLSLSKPTDKKQDHSERSDHAHTCL